MEVTNMLTELQKRILRLYGARERSKKPELLSSKEVATELNSGNDIVIEELKKLEVMGLLNLQGAFQNDYSAKITGLGMVVLDQIGWIADEELKQAQKPICA